SELPGPIKPMSKRTPVPGFKSNVASLSLLFSRCDNQNILLDFVDSFGSINSKPSIVNNDPRMSLSNSLPYIDFSEPLIASVCEPMAVNICKNDVQSRD